jgi:hypothetical protein
MGPPSVPTLSEQGRRKRPAESNHPNERTRRRRTVEVNEDDSEVDYDPDQDIEVRRRLRKGLRDLSKNLLENRAEFLNPSSTGLRDTILKANELSGEVKQTTDATIDSRLLTTVAEYSYKKTVALISGDTAQGVDVDEFISRCLSFMRQGAREAGQAPSNTQRRRRRDDDEDDEDDNDGEVVDWAYLGRHASVRNNSRPSVSGFLLGPLSLQKRVRAQVVRKAAFRPNNLQETRPEVLQADDITKSEAGLTTLCTQILTRLKKVQAGAINAVEAQTRDDMADKEVDELLDRYGVSKGDGGLAFFKFVINPHSFGQTIENMFYVSFLIRDGKVGISMDDRGLPYLSMWPPPRFIPDKGTDRFLDFPEVSGGKVNGHEKAKHQAVLAIDMDYWEQLIDVFDIKEPMIRHREEEEHSNVGKKGWYA